MISAMRQSGSSDSFYIKFYPHLNKTFGSKYVALMIDRLEYWFSKKKFKEGFFKFIEPCSHYLYKTGDSWSEEIGIKRKAFNAAFLLIGISYESKTAFLAEEDPFKGKLYARYYDRKTNRMFFIRNHHFAEQFFQKLFSVKDKPQVSSRQAEKGVSQHQNPQEERAGEGEKGRSWNDQKGRSQEGGYKDIIQNTTNNSSLQAATQMSKDPVKGDSKPEEEMKKIWEEEIGPIHLAHISASLMQQMKRSFETQFACSLDEWRHYCQQIASSKFLMGEKPNTQFKAWLWWAIKPEVIERMRAGGFTLGDRVVCQKQKEINLEKLSRENLEKQITLEGRQFHELMLQAMGVGKYYHWFRHVQIESTVEKIVLLVPRALEKNYLEQHYNQTIKHALHKVFGKNRQEIKVRI